MIGPSTDPRAPAPGTVPPKRSGTEAALLGFAVFITLVAQCIVDLSLTCFGRGQIKNDACKKTIFCLLSRRILE